MKYFGVPAHDYHMWSPPARGRELKFCYHIDEPDGSLSPPARGRELKSFITAAARVLPSRPPRGGGS